MTIKIYLIDADEVAERLVAEPAAAHGRREQGTRDPGGVQRAKRGAGDLGPLVMAGRLRLEAGRELPDPGQQPLLVSGLPSERGHRLPPHLR